MDSRQDDDGVPRLQAEEERRGEMQAEVGFAGGEGRRDVGGPLLLDVLHLGEPLAAQQLFGHILGGLTDAGNLDQPEPRRLRRRLRGDRPGVHSQGAPPSPPASTHPGTSAG